MNASPLEDTVQQTAATRSHCEKFVPLHGLFQSHAHQRPEAPALTAGDRTLTYGELNELAERMAFRLRALDVDQHAMVGICMHRGIEMIVAVLAALKIGAAYVPIDAGYPKQRIDHMLSALPFATVLVTEETKGHALARVPVLEVDRELARLSNTPYQPPDCEISNDDLAYVVFTSGSTGEPKAAGVTHGGWSNLLLWFKTEFQIASHDRVLIVSSFGFDITQRSIMMPLIVGAHLIVMSERHFDPTAIANTIRTTQSTVINCAPSMFYPVIEQGAQRYADFNSLRLVFLGGEAISASRIRTWAESSECNAKIVNVYGVAECSDVSTYHVLQDYRRYIASSVPLGLPIFNSEVLLLSDEGQPTTAGAIGEICLSGVGVGVGYVNDAELTARKFVPHPFSPKPGSVVYKTGDLGRIASDGRLEYHGRKDFQVKVNGVRLELGEIESTLRQNPLIREAVAMMKVYGEHDHRLVAFVTLQRTIKSGKLIQSVRSHLSEKLPPHLVPGEIFEMEELPLTPNGKIDRAALQALCLDELRPKHAADPRPRTDTEQRLARIFSSVLRLDDVSLEDNFFHIGGNSYLLTEAMAEINETISRQVNILDFLAQPNVVSLAKVIDGLVVPIKEA